VASNNETGTTAEAAEARSDQGGVTSTKAGDSGSGSSGGSPDPDTLVQEIEQTREDLAETLDAIVDRVSPKRVIDRTKEQARSEAQDALQTVKESASSAAQTVKGKAQIAAEAVKEQVASVKERVSGGHEAGTTALAAPPATASATSSRRLSGASASSQPASGVDDQPLPGSPLAGGAELSGSPLPSDTVSVSSVDTGSEMTGTGPAAAGSTGTSRAVRTPGTSVVPTSFPSPVLPPAVSSKAPILAGAGAAVAVVLLLLRRRRR